jgi:hypothetical protein
MNDGVQVVLQAQRGTNGFSCKTFVSDMSVRPTLIAVCHAPSQAAESLASDLELELHGEIVGLAGPPNPAQAPCGGNVSNPFGCNFAVERLLVVLVGDGQQPLVFPSWISGQSPVPTFLPVFHATDRGRIATLLPPALSGTNVAQWENSIGEVVPDVLASAGITTPHPRIFISYKRDDSQSLANQLFDALAHENYDVFLDHYRIAPGIHLLARIRQELGDKTMMVLIESWNILVSRWTRFEVNTALSLRLGLCALNVPGGTRVHGAGRKRRVQLQDGDFVGGRFHANAHLDDASLARVVGDLKRRHDRALLWRRQLVRNSVRDALLRLGVTNQHFDSTGLLKVTSLPPTSKSYAVWMTSRSPELNDFFAVQPSLISGTKGVVVGLARLLEPLRAQQIVWLSDASDIEMVDEGKITVAANLIAHGNL